MDLTEAAPTILVELDKQTREEQFDRFEQWLGNVLTAQTAFSEMAEDTIGKVHEPHIKDAISDIADRGKEHEQKVEELYHIIGRDPSTARKLAGNATAKFGGAVADLQGLLGGAVGGWKDIHQLLLANLNAFGGFSIAEQLGLALGLPEVVNITFPVIHQKQTDQLILQEYMLEMGAVAILYKEYI